MHDWRSLVMFRIIINQPLEMLNFRILWGWNVRGSRTVLAPQHWHLWCWLHECGLWRWRFRGGWIVRPPWQRHLQLKLPILNPQHQHPKLQRLMRKLGSAGWYYCSHCSSSSIHNCAGFGGPHLLFPENSSSSAWCQCNWVTGNTAVIIYKWSKYVYLF